MSDRYDLCVGRSYESNGERKTSWTKIGVMFKSRNGDGYDITLEALPLPELYEGKLRTSIKAFAPKPRDGGGYGGGAPQRPGPGSDDVPF
jgi:hypothetical protein